MYTHEVITGISLQLTEEAIQQYTSYKGTVQYWWKVGSQSFIVPFCTLLRQHGAMSQDRQGRFNFKIFQT